MESQVAFDQDAEQQPEGAVGQGHDGEPGPDSRTGLTGGDIMVSEHD
jgi:hypothetical protein